MIVTSQDLGPKKVANGEGNSLISGKSGEPRAQTLSSSEADLAKRLGGVPWKWIHCD